MVRQEGRVRRGEAGHGRGGLQGRGGRGLFCDGVMEGLLPGGCWDVVGIIPSRINVLLEFIKSYVAGLAS